MRTGATREAFALLSLVVRPELEGHSQRRCGWEALLVAVILHLFDQAPQLDRHSGCHTTRGEPDERGRGAQRL